MGKVVKQFLSWGIPIAIAGAGWFGLRPYLYAKLSQDLQADRAAYNQAEQIATRSTGKPSVDEIVGFYEELCGTKIQPIREDEKTAYGAEFKRDGLEDTITLQIGGREVCKTNRKAIEGYIERHSR